MEGTVVTCATNDGSVSRWAALRMGEDLRTFTKGSPLEANQESCLFLGWNVMLDKYVCVFGSW